MVFRFNLNDRIFQPKTVTIAVVKTTLNETYFWMDLRLFLTVTVLG